MSDLVPNAALALGEPSGPMEAAIDPRFSEELLELLASDLKRDLEVAQSAKRGIDDRVERYRAYFAVDRLPQQYENQPNHRVPYIRGKVNGASAHFRAALDQDPLFVTRPYTAKAQDAQGPWEVMMERELDRSGSRRQIFAAVEEGTLTGTGIVQLSVVEVGDEQLVQAKAVRLDDFFVAPIGVEDVSRCSTFYRYREPWHIIRRHFDQGYYDEAMRERTKAASDTSESNYDERIEGTDIFTSHLSENTPRTLYECYYRWEHPDVGPGLWRIIYHNEGSIILRVEENPYADAFDAPPYAPIRPMPRIDFFFGESYAQVLEGVQNVLDFAYNAKLAYDQLAITPILFIDQDSEAWNTIKDKQLAPGMKIPTVGNPQESVYALPLPPPSEAMNLLATARALGDDATFNDLLMQGLPTNKVRSATEISAVLNTATKHLQRDLSNIAVDLSTFAMMYWRLIFEFKIRPLGVRPVFEGSDQYLIGAQDIDEEELIGELVMFMGNRMGIPLTPEMAQQTAGLLRQQLGESLFVAGAMRDDMEWVPNGGTLLPEKLARANKMERMMASMLTIFMYAQQFKPIWVMAKQYLESMGVVNWRELLPAEPPTETEIPPEVTQQINEAMNMTRQGGGSGS